LSSSSIHVHEHDWHFNDFVVNKSSEDKDDKSKEFSNKEFLFTQSQETHQITIVLQVSTVDLWAAEAYFVIITPVKLKPAIETILHKD
jgi:hypothetical protein